ncbi:MAG: hypothetical protein AAGI13_04875, partial [Pseudomonadota bacterium]
CNCCELAVTAPLLGIICGMQAEADALGRLILDKRVTVSISGARPDLAEEGALWCLEQGCVGLMSFGLAGGLAAGLMPGDLLGAEKVVTEAGCVVPLVEVPGQVRENSGPTVLLGSETIVLDAAEKTRLNAATGAVAVDMESHRVAKVAAEAALPVWALRAVGDPVGASLPPFVANALSATGHPRIGPVLAGLARSPGWLPALLRLRRDSQTGLAALAAAVQSGTIARVLDLLSDAERA